MRIALDAMGSDVAPDVPVAGAVAAVRELPASHEILLVGRQAEVHEALAKHDIPADRIHVVNAPEVIDMSEKPLAAVRGKRKSSIRVGVELQKRGEAHAFISGGNTGAVMAACTLLLGLHPGVERPAIGTVFPTRAKPVLVLDAGANIDCSPRELRGFAHIGSVYARDVLGRTNPSVCLLNIGEEEEKGNEAVRSAYELLKNDRGLRFAGNVEGRDILNGECDVVVCDGFVGNVVLKFYESVARLFSDLLKNEIDPRVLESTAMNRVFRILDYSEYGGAPLLGVRGVAIICHGNSPVRAIKNAIGVAAQAVESHLSQHIAAELAGDGAVV
ncbi:MAG: phosphate acyltransferase PlsX [Gemmatimonadales bacterium]|nr:phosphate acyltransferase PlsX [Gemmatimonadales bacterium]NIN11615.1 phosphate acyltransferase PlsX [Gemmatimonadales bacterium]NIN50221.1 phosphate acyltransferase PlsX [Gemmatimonadales bacterium]NIP07685.1 phosphate acyltransferase PlsX [Gemmatimonadales bacterium]NIR01837.1 phosphate acyltransferase PlsX [Gemmatimonadales bacterium]